MKMFKMIFNIEKEEQWLNEQLQKGYRCKSISGLGTYVFEETNKKYVIRLDYRGYLSRKKHEEYKGIYEDFGWNYVKGYSIGGVQYWQKEAGTQDDIFSDRQSKGNYYKRLMNYSFGIALVSLFISFSMYMDKGFSGLYHEGLWNMEGSLFWKAFIFESPFVLLKLVPAIIVVIFATSFFKAYQKYTILKEK